MIQINPLQSYIDGGARAAITTPPSASLVFDLPGKAIWVKGVKLKGIDHTYTFSHDNYITLTNTPDQNNPESEDIKIGVNITALKNVIDTTYSVVTASSDGLAPAFSNGNKATTSANTTYHFLGLAGSTLKWYELPHRNIYVETTEVLSVSNTDPLKFAAGDGIQITWDSTNKKIVITNSSPDVNHNTDNKVAQASTSTNYDYPIILKGSSNLNENITNVNFSQYLSFNPSTKILKINNSKVITENDIYVGATSSANATVGLVPAATSAQRTYFLRGDGTWQQIAAQDTWRPVKVEGTQKLASTTDTDALDFHGDTGIEITYDATNKKINIKNTAPDLNHNTDFNVQQTPKTDNVNRPLMMINGSTSAGELTSTSMFSTGIYANASTKTITANGFIKSGYDDTSVLLAGGGAKALTDFAMSDAYVKKIGDTMSGSLAFNTTSTNHIEFTSSTYYTGGASEHTSIGYGRFQCWGQIRINADTDESKSEYVLLTSGRGVSDSITDGLAIGYNTLTWLGNTVWHEGNDGSGSGLDADLLDGTHKADLLTAASLGASGNSTTLSVTVGGTTKTGSVTVPYATSAGNADTVDGYHASQLWRSDGATWNPGANVTLNATANSQEWSIDMYRNGYTGTFWHVWDSARSIMLGVYPDTGKVHAPYGFVGDLEGNATTATTASTANSVSWSNVTSGTNNKTLYLNFPSFVFRDANGGWILGKSNNSTGEISIGSSAIAQPVCLNSSGGTVYLTGGGNVGIGTTSPSYKLHVNGTTFGTGSIGTNSSFYSYSTNPMIFYGSGSGTYDQAALYVSQSDGITFETPRASNSGSAAIRSFQIRTRGGLVAPLVCGSITCSSIQGDSTSNRAIFRHLDGQNCSGDYDLYLQYHVSGAIRCCLNVYAPHYYESSDIRLKHDISSISKSIRRFRFNNDNKLYYGFIAQELETLHPELVDSSGEYKTVNYNSAICYYIAELENKVQKLEDEINKLKNK